MGCFFDGDLQDRSVRSGCVLTGLLHYLRTTEGMMVRERFEVKLLKSMQGNLNVVLASLALSMFSKMVCDINFVL